MVFVIGFVIVSCEQENPLLEEANPEIESELTERQWRSIFNEPFNNLSRWEKTNRADYNSSTCRYKPKNADVISIGNKGNKALRLTARKLGFNNFESGHIKSIQKFKPGNNEEIRFRSRIKFHARKNGNKVAFHETYGAWPAFWTVEENGWPTKGEIDIMEAYTYGSSNNDKYACNMFYGTNINRNILSGTVKNYTSKIKPTAWNKYEMRWKNKNGNHEVKIYVNGQFVKKYNNNNTSRLQLQKFTPHNIILNLNVGTDRFPFFDNAKVNLFDKTIMLVDWVKVDKRNL